MEYIEGDYIGNTDPTMEAAHTVEHLERRGFEIDSSLYDSTVTMDYCEYAAYECARLDIGAARSREARKFAYKKGTPRGRKAYLTARQCKGCGVEFQPKTDSRVYCSATCTKKSKALCIEIDGEIKTVKEWAEIGGVSVPTIKSRIRRGWAIDRAVIAPLKT